MHLRRLLDIHAPAWDQTHTQALATARVLGQDDPRDAFAAPGRGPGGGPLATPYNTALIVLAVLAGGAQTRSRVAVDAYFVLPLEGGPEQAADIVEPGTDPVADALAELRDLPRCPLTGAGMFGEAVTELLAHPELADRVARIEARRGVPDVSIYTRDGARIRFVAPHDARRAEARDARGELAVTATLGGDVLAELARDLAE